MDSKYQADRIDMRKKKTDTQNRTTRAIQWVLNSPVVIFHMLIYLNPKRGGVAQKTALTGHKQGNYTSSIPEASSSN